jgi:hypothetical protein
MPVAALFLECLPAWRISGGMGQAYLIEGFSRADVQAVLRLRGLRGTKRRDAWDLLLAMEAAYRDLRLAAMPKPKPKPTPTPKSTQGPPPRRIIQDIE